MYEGKEGVRVILESGRLEIQPGAVHLWCKINSEIVTFIDWLLQYVYLVNRNLSSILNLTNGAIL